MTHYDRKERESFVYEMSLEGWHMEVHLAFGCCSLVGTVYFLQTTSIKNHKNFYTFATHRLGAQHLYPEGMVAFIVKLPKVTTSAR